MATSQASLLSRRHSGSGVRASSAVRGASSVNPTPGEWALLRGPAARSSGRATPPNASASAPRSSSLATAGRGVLDRPSSGGSDGPRHAAHASAALAPDWRELLAALYREQCPERLGGLDDLLKVYKGEEESLYFRVCERYGSTPAVSRSKTSSSPQSTFVEVAALKCERGPMTTQVTRPEPPKAEQSAEKGRSFLLAERAGDGSSSLAPPRREAAREAAGEPRRRPMQERDWFTELFGFTEDAGYQATQERLKGNARSGARCTLVGKDRQEYQVGNFSTPSLRELRAAVGRMGKLDGRLSVRNVVGDVSIMHADAHNRHATFQVASQFNCLEFPSESTTPEKGIVGYVHDHTQGPACAIACGPATAFRNYLANVRGSMGQTKDRQINNLSGILEKLQNDEKKFLQIVNGYTMADSGGLSGLNAVLETLSAAEREELQEELRVGVQEDAQVTSCNWGQWQIRDKSQTVTQVFGSACSVSYSKPCSDRSKWEPFARLVLSASYEATLWAALAAALRHKGRNGSNRVYLTSIGGGVFGNHGQWIIDAMAEAFAKFQNVGLEVYIVSYGSVEHGYDALARRFTD